MQNLNVNPKIEYLHFQNSFNPEQKIQRNKIAASQQMV